MIGSSTTADAFWQQANLSEQWAELSESETIRRAQRGDSDAFERIYRAHCRRIYALCLRMAGNSAEAEDLTQEAFLTVLRKIQTFRGDSAFSTWLHRIAVNLVLMRFLRKVFIWNGRRPMRATEIRLGANACGLL